MQNHPLATSRFPFLKRRVLVPTFLAVGLLLAITLPLAAAQTTPAQGVSASSTNRATTKSESTPKKARALPFHGKIKTVDKAARAFTIGERTFLVTAESKVMKQDKTPATLSAVVVGEQVSGSYRKTDDGRLLVNSLYIGPKDAAAEKASPKSTEKPAKTNQGSKP